MLTVAGSETSSAGSIHPGFPGWPVGVAGAPVVVIAASGAIGTGSDGAPSHGTSTVKLVLGVALLGLGLRNWRRRPGPGETATLPKWLQAIEDITPVKAVALGILLSALNPKNLLMIVGGGLAIAGAPASDGGKVVAAVVFVLLAISTVIIPVVLYRALGDRAKATLESLNTWLQANNSTVMAVLFLVIGVALIGKGIGGF
jgi:threonine/homoserine/homoserine lactone efflux protein